MNVNIGNKAENTIVVKGLVIVEIVAFAFIGYNLIIELWNF